MLPVPSLSVSAFLTRSPSTKDIHRTHTYTRSILEQQQSVDRGALSLSLSPYRCVYISIGTPWNTSHLSIVVLFLSLFLSLYRCVCVRLCVSHPQSLYGGQPVRRGGADGHLSLEAPRPLGCVESQQVASFRRSLDALHHPRCSHLLVRHSCGGWGGGAYITLITLVATIKIK